MASILDILFRRRAARLFGLLVLIALAGCSRTPQAAVTSVKLLVNADGVYQVTAGELTAVGFDLGDELGHLTLTAGGAPVAFELTGQGRNRVLRFYGEALGPEAHTATNVYWLTQGPPASGDTAGRITEDRQPLPAGVTAAQVVTATVHIEEQRQHRSDAGETGDRWTWHTLFAPADFEFKANTPVPADGSGVLSLHVVANSQAESDPDHHLTIAVNGTPVADAMWDGLGPHVITATIPTGVLLDGDNAVRLAAPGDTGAPADVIILDRAELAFARRLVLDGETLAFSGDAAAYDIELAEQPVLLWDITAPAQPVALSVTGAQDSRLTIPGGAGRRFVAVTERGLRRPAAILPVAASDLPDFPGGADLLIVTVPQFREALQPLVEARTAQGLRVAVVDVAAVNDAFNHGRTGPDGIRGLVEHALAAWEPPAPRYLLLAGDASYDPRGYLNGSETDLVPAREVYTTYSGWTASDVWYAMPDDGPAAKPRLAIGRLPAQTPEQMAIMVRKTLAYEQATGSAAWQRRALLVADNDEQGFADETADFAARLTGYDTQQVTIAEDGRAAREQLISAFDGGTGLIGYFGHGSVVLWAQEKVFATEDVAQLTNRDRLPIVFTVTCLSGFFSHPTTPSLGETLLRADNGGAVAALVPSSAAILSDQRLLAQNLADALAGDTETLGEAVLRAQGGLPEALGGVREILLTFNLLGDPTLPLSR